MVAARERVRVEEKRRQPRVPCDQVAGYVRSGVESAAVEFEEGTTTVLNKSAEGMLLRMPTPLDPGRILEVTFHPEGNPELHAVLEVRWSKPSQSAEGRQYFVGCRNLFACLS